MLVTLREEAPSYSMVEKSAAEFKHGRESVENDPHLGGPGTVTAQETIAKIHDVIMTDRRVTELYLVTQLGIS